MIFPPIPSWPGMHVIIVHFPLGILFATPVFAGLDIVFFTRHRAWGKSAFILLALGSLAAWLAVFSGTAAEDLVDKTEAVAKVLHLHAELGEWARTIFTALTIVFGAMVYGPGWLKRTLSYKWELILRVAFFVVLIASLILLANVGYLGGEMVHKLGVRSVM